MKFLSIGRRHRLGLFPWVDELDGDVLFHALVARQEIGDALAQVAHGRILGGGVGGDPDRSLEQGERLDTAFTEAVAGVLGEIPFAKVLLGELREQQCGGHQQGGEHAVLGKQSETGAARGDHAASRSRSRRRTVRARNRPVSRTK